MATATSIDGIGTCNSIPHWEVHMPVFFCRATSRITLRSSPLEVSSRRSKMWRVISIK